MVFFIFIQIFIVCTVCLCTKEEARIILVNTKNLIRGELYSKFSFGEVYHRIYGQKFSFTVTCEWSRKT